LLLACAGARASTVPIAWTEHWAPLTPRLYAQGYTTGTIHYVSFTTNFAQTLASNPGVPTGVVAANLTAVSSAPSSRPDYMNAEYTLSLLLTDEASNAWKTLRFRGQLTGTFWYGGSSLRTTFLSPNLQTFYLGRNFYAAMLGYMAPVRYTTNRYTIGSYIAVVPATWLVHSATAATPLTATAVCPLCDSSTVGAPGASPQASPEPSTLVLAFLGLSAVGGGAWWRRRAATVGA
jgi:hypothetical protein